MIDPQRKWAVAQGDESAAPPGWQCVNVHSLWEHPSGAQVKAMPSSTVGDRIFWQWYVGGRLLGAGGCALEAMLRADQCVGEGVPYRPSPQQVAFFAKELRNRWEGVWHHLGPEIQDALIDAQVLLAAMARDQPTVDVTWLETLRLELHDRFRGGPE